MSISGSYMDLNVPPLCSSLCNEDRINSKEINDTGCSTCKHAANLEEKNESRKKQHCEVSEEVFCLLFCPLIMPIDKEAAVVRSITCRCFKNTKCMGHSWQMTYTKLQ